MIAALRLGMALLLLGGPAAAQLPPSRNIHIAAQGPWSVDCTAEPQTGERWCQVGARIESREPAYRVEFNYVRDSRMFFAMGATWLSVVRVRVDGQPPFTIDRCLSGMCLMKGDNAARLLAQMRGGRSLELSFQAEARPQGVLAIELTEFEPMYQRALKAPR